MNVGDVVAINKKWFARDAVRHLSEFCNFETGRVIKVRGERCTVRFPNKKEEDFSERVLALHRVQQAEDNANVRQASVRYAG